MRLLAVLLVGVVAVLPAAPANGAPVTPYVDPPFAATCEIHQFGEGEVPDLAGLPDDPLCVEYAKRDITLNNGGAIRFLIAEPARVLLAATRCRYWQQDHWSVQAARGQTPVIRWDGSYWFDLGAGQAGARISDLTIAGQPATLAEAARRVAPYSPALAAYFLTYAHGGDGAVLTAGFPLHPLCPR